ncbi:hypothetical protein ABK040_012117 [Willaertia magna]
MASAAVSRLKKEYIQLKKNPLENITCTPLENNLLEWHFVIHDLPYEIYKGGYYHGKLTFPSEYPYKPPSIQLFTPNGRFKVNTKICTSFTDFHKESWNPLWGLSSLLKGFLSFMLEDDPSASSVGAISTTEQEKKQLAKASASFNAKNPLYCKLFAELVEKAKREEEEERELSNNNSNNGNAVVGENGKVLKGNDLSSQGNNQSNWINILVVIIAILFILYISL